MDRCGVWLVGALGNLATTMIAGTRALARDLTSPGGLLTEQPEVAALGLSPLDQYRFGGWEIRAGTLEDSAREIHRANGSLRYELLDAIRDDLRLISSDLRPGLSAGCGATIERLQTEPPSDPHATTRQQVEGLVRDLEDFRERHHLTRLIVVNLASTEPPVDDGGRYASLQDLEHAIDHEPPGTLRAGALYAHAAFLSGAAVLNFTPSHSSLCAANKELAHARGLPYMGNDGKTGETLVKSALAPMFKYRNLQVDSWIGYNILGNRDGEVLADDDNKRSKLESKDSVLSSILGYPLHTHVGIDYVPSLGDQKVAWDHIQFRGFLDHRMTMQFVWDGCDSILAAPLVLDLVRFLDDALIHEVGGPLSYLASFFKDPIHCEEHDLHRQFNFLTEFLAARNEGRRA